MSIAIKIQKKLLGVTRFEPRAVGWEAWALPLCCAASLVATEHESNYFHLNYFSKKLKSNAECLNMLQNCIKSFHFIWNGDYSLLMRLLRHSQNGKFVNAAKWHIFILVHSKYLVHDENFSFPEMQKLHKSSINGHKILWPFMLFQNFQRKNVFWLSC